jgi:putative ATP-dependent endonuclease of OLD family
LNIAETSLSSLFWHLTAMARLNSLTIENYRSIQEQVTLNLPVGTPTILLGENNAGKSNIIRALDLMFGEFHPKYKKLEDYDHHNRSTSNQILIQAEVSGFQGRINRNRFSCGGFEFRKARGRETEYFAIQQEDGQPFQYVNSELREELLCIVVNSDMNLNYQLSYSSKFTLLSKVTKAFHDKLVQCEDRVDRLKDLFNSVRLIFHEVTEFSDFNANMSAIAGQMLSNMTHALKFDFSAYDPSNYFKALRVHPVEGQEFRAVEELGTGQQQILALSFAHAYAKSFLGQGLIFVIDEPEAHLHPLAQKWLAKKMYEMARDGLQVVITTHSPFFINLEYLEGINLVKKNQQTHILSRNAAALASHCRSKGAARAAEHTIVPFYSGNSTPELLNGFFANKVVLVEGPTEEFALPFFLEAVGFDPLENGVAIISVGGKSNLAKWWRFFTCYQIPSFVCFDNDSSHDSNGTHRKDALKAIGIPEEELNAVLTADNWNINRSFCVFGVDYEVTMRSSFANYLRYEEEARQLLGSSKPIVARSVASKITSDERMDNDLGWSRFTSLANVIRCL